MSRGPVPVVLCLDVEPDPRQVSRTDPEPWRGHENACERVEELRARLTERTGTPARFTWFLRFDDQIAAAYGRTWVVEAHRDHLDAVRAHGDALGLHVHPYRWLDDAQAWLSDYGSSEVTASALRTSAAAFAEALGAPPRLLRFGDGWMDTATLSLAEELGIEVDLTPEPGERAGAMRLEERATGERADTRRLPRGPYVPDRHDFRAPSGSADRAIGVLPLTAVRVRERRPWRRPLVTLAPWRAWPARRPLRAMLDQALAAPAPHLVLAVRTGDWVPGSVVARRIESFFDSLVDHPAAERLVVCSPQEALELLGY